jgi:hypothetical protein
MLLDVSLIDPVSSSASATLWGRRSMFGSTPRVLVLLGIVLFSACSDQGGAVASKARQAQPTNRPVPPPPPPPPPSVTDVITPVIECYRKITSTLATVHDEQSARAAAPILAQTTDQLKPAMERLTAAVKAAMVSRTPIPGGGNVDDNAKAFYDMQSQIERVYHSPAGQSIKPEIRRLLDTLVQSAFAAERDRLLRWIQDQKLNQ